VREAFSLVSEMETDPSAIEDYVIILRELSGTLEDAHGATHLPGLRTQLKLISKK
jgi:hypothetical protein